MKKKLHIHSDNATWAGCENMPGIFLQDKDISETFDVNFSYRYSKEYVKGMNKWVFVLWTIAKLYPLHFPVSFLYKLRSYFRPVMVLKYPFMLWEVGALYKLFKRIKPDILHINNGGYFGATSCNSAAIAGRLAGIKKITYMLNSTTIDHWWERPITYFVKKSVTKFITASQDLKEKSIFLHRLSDERKRIGWLENWEVIPNTVLCRDISMSVVDVKEKLGCKGNILFLGCGVLERRKGFDVLIKAFENLPIGGPARTLVIAGKGSMGKQLRGMVEKSEASVCIYEEGKIDDYTLINACDVLVVPSIADEDFPNVILIATMLGKPIIVTDLAGLPETVIKIINGLIVKKNDVASLNVSLGFLLNCPLNRRTMASKSLNVFEERYKVEKIMKKYIELWSK